MKKFENGLEVVWSGDNRQVLTIKSEMFDHTSNSQLRLIDGLTRVMRGKGVSLEKGETASFHYIDRGVGAVAGIAELTAELYRGYGNRSLLTIDFKNKYHDYSDGFVVFELDTVEMMNWMKAIA